MASELKPCPFCGSAAILRDAQVSEDCMDSWVECKSCGATTDRHESPMGTDNPIAAWNTRPVEDALVEALQSIRLYANDTLSGRVDGPDDRDWQRTAVIELRDRARAALKQAGRE